MNAKLRKLVAYAYPTSSNAERFGYGASGCYTVNIEIAGSEQPDTCVAAFPDYEAAAHHASKIKLDTSPYCLTHKKGGSHA